MKTVVTIKAVEVLAGDKFFKVEWLDKQGTLCSDTVAEETLVELVQDSKIKVEYNEEDEMVSEVLQNMEFSYIEVSVALDSDVEEYDVYNHEADVKWGEIEMDFCGELVKTFKSEDKAIKWVEKKFQGITIKAI